MELFVFLVIIVIGLVFLDAMIESQIKATRRLCSIPVLICLCYAGFLAGKMRH